MALWDNFTTALRATYAAADYAFANIPSTRACQSPADSGSATGPVAARAGAPTLSTDGVDVEGLPVLNIAVEYEESAGSVADVQVYTWLMDEDDNWHQLEDDGSPQVLISSALASTRFKAGPTFDNEGWKRIYHEFVASDAGASKYVKVKVFPHNE